MVRNLVFPTLLSLNCQSIPNLTLNLNLTCDLDLNHDLDWVS